MFKILQNTLPRHQHTCENVPSMPGRHPETDRWECLLRTLKHAFGCFPRNPNDFFSALFSVGETKKNRIEQSQKCKGAGGRQGYFCRQKKW